MPLRRSLIRLHRWMGIGAAIFWLIQAITGVLIVFHWEAQDALLSNLHRPTDLVAIERRLDQLAPPGSGASITSVWTSAGLPDRYDVTVKSNTDKRSVRIAGDGTVLRDRLSGTRDPFDTLVVIHQTLLAGDLGSWIVGISGMLLITNLLFGLYVAWPRNRAWRQALRPLNKGPLPAKLYSWHRAVGLWAVVPALLLASAGVARVFDDGFESLLGVSSPKLAPVTAPGPRVGFAAAVQAAQRALPGGQLTMVAMPDAEDATYRVRLLEPDQWRRAYGTSTVLVDGVTGKARAVYPARSAPIAKRFADAIYATHTGEIAGLAGRLLVLLTGLWLAVMTVLGLWLWMRRGRRWR